MNEVVAEVEATELVARVLGEDYCNLPKDLYIPPGAMQIFLEAFEGPLDLLLYLIKRQNLDILNIPIAEITRQYVSYVEMMETSQIELASEYMVMAAMFASHWGRINACGGRSAFVAVSGVAFPFAFAALRMPRLRSRSVLSAALPGIF